MVRWLIEKKLMARVTSNPHCSCNASFHPDHTLQDRCVHLPQVHPSSEHGSVCAVFLFLGALQMQHPGVTSALLRMQLPLIKTPPSQSTIRVPLRSHHQLEKVSFVCCKLPFLLHRSTLNSCQPEQLKAWAPRTNNSFWHSQSQLWWSFLGLTAKRLKTRY